MSDIISGQIAVGGYSEPGFGFNPFAKLATKIDVNRLPTQAQAEAKQAEREAAEPEAMADDEDDEPEAEQVEEIADKVVAEQPEAQAEDKGEEPKSETKPRAKRPFGPSAVSAILASEAKKRDKGDELAARLAAGEFVMWRVLRNHRNDKDADEMEARVFAFIYRSFRGAGERSEEEDMGLTKAWMKEARRPPKFSPKKAGELIATALRQGDSPVGQARWILDVVAKDGRYSHQEQHNILTAVKIALKGALLAMARPASSAAIVELLKKQPKREPPKPAGLHGGPKPKEPEPCYGSTAAKQPERQLSPKEREELKVKQELEAEAAKAERIQRHAKAERIRRQAEAAAARKRRGYGEQTRVAPPKPKPQDKDEGKNKGKGCKGKGGRNQRAA